MSVDCRKGFASGNCIRQGEKIRVMLKSRLEHPVVSGLWDLAGAELREMPGHELRVEKCVTACQKTGDKVHERHFRSVTLAREHALAKEGGSQ